tara:strand:- start:673 stop:957 length:285 start_codon:yes stop_codon:yes gene_type:complete
MSAEKKLNTCPDCQGNGYHKFFTNIFEDETGMKTCATCGGSGVLSDEHYAKFSEEDKRQAEDRWIRVHSPKRKNRTLHISEVLEGVMSELRRGY